MRIEKAPRKPPESSGPAGRLTTAEERFVWEVLAPRLLNPSNLAFIQALLEQGRPLRLDELAEAAEITEEDAGDQCKSMQKAGVLEVVSVDGERDEPSYFFTKPTQPVTSAGRSSLPDPGDK
jgi:hypothetical protein